MSGLEVVRDGLAQDLDKCRVFSKQVARAVGLEKETAEILATGDFAHDAIIMRAEQLIKLEVSRGVDAVIMRAGGLCSRCHYHEGRAAD